jgi:hypothetical protein
LRLDPEQRRSPVPDRSVEGPRQELSPEECCNSGNLGRERNGGKVAILNQGKWLFMSRGPCGDDVACQPDNNGIRLRRRQHELRSSTACQEETARRSGVAPHGVKLNCGEVTEAEK